PLWKNERSFQEELMSLYSERGWTLDAKRSTERNDGYDDPAWNVAGKRGGDVLDLGFVASLVTFDDVGVVKIGDAGDAWVRTGSKFGTAKVHVRAEAEAVLALF
ncbi:MAG TPA: hypothetical protein VF407_10575, partial [Polyangiaceae bacterium]